MTNQFDRTRQHRQKSKTIVLAGMIGALAGAAMAGGSFVAYTGIESLDFIPTAILALLITGAGAVCIGGIGAALAYVID